MTGLIASIPMGQAGKRTALANLVLNLIGVSMFVSFSRQLADFVSGLNDDPGMAVATAHLVFNLGVALVALPCVRPLARWLEPSDAGT